MATAPGLRLVLWDLRSPINIGMILRLAETYEVGVGILGSRSVLDDAEKMRTLSDFACGALQRVGFTALADAAAVTAFARGARLIATSIEPASTPLDDVAPAANDIVMLGNEYDGLPAEAIAAAALSVRIRMADVWTPKPSSASPIDPSRMGGVSRDGMPNLNVAIAGGILCHHWHVARLRRRP